jgi:peptide methionine sulfoxide reductase MsrA
MTRTNEMTNPQARTKHRTTVQIAELCLQSAEDYHQQYLSSNKNPHGYCPDHGTGVSCPVGVARADG